jgi:hypothetical protein
MPDRITGYLLSCGGGLVGFGLVIVLGLAGIANNDAWFFLVPACGMGAVIGYAILTSRSAKTSVEVAPQVVTPPAPASVTRPPLRLAPWQYAGIVVVAIAVAAIALGPLGGPSPPLASIVGRGPVVKGNYMARPNPDTVQLLSLSTTGTAVTGSVTTAYIPYLGAPVHTERVSLSGSENGEQLSIDFKTYVSFPAQGNALLVDQASADLQSGEVVIKVAHDDGSTTTEAFELTNVQTYDDAIGALMTRAASEARVS